MKVLTIGNDRKIFESGSKARNKAIEIGSLFDEYHIIIYAQKSLDLKPEKISRNTWVVPTNSWNRWFFIPDAIIIGRKMSNVDIVSCQDLFESGPTGYVLSKLLKTKLQVQIHTDFLNPHFKRNLLDVIRVIIAKFILPKADIVRVVSSRIKRSIENFKLKAKVFVLPVYVDIERITYEKPKFDLRKKYKFSRIILMASRLEEEKGVALAVDVFKEVSKKCKDVAFVIVGDGKLRKSLEERSKNNNVFFEGWQEDVISYYKGADIYLSTSLYEGYGLSLMEASLSGLPVVTTDVGIAGDTLMHNVNALICPVNDKECLTGSLQRLIEDKGLHDKLKGNAQKISEKIPPQPQYRYLEEYKKTVCGS